MDNERVGREQSTALRQVVLEEMTEVTRVDQVREASRSYIAYSKGGPRNFLDILSVPSSVCPVQGSHLLHKVFSLRTSSTTVCRQS